MKNVQVIDSAINCVYDIFQVTDDEYSEIFKSGQDIAFIEDLELEGVEIPDSFWNKRLPKKDAVGIHGVIFYGLLEKKIFYPDFTDEGAMNPNGSRLR